MSRRTKSAKQATEPLKYFCQEKHNLTFHLIRLRKNFEGSRNSLLRREGGGYKFQCTQNWRAKEST